MMYLVGLGLGDAKDITVKGLEIVRKCDRVYLETYTSVLAARLEDLERYYGRSILEADRELVENNADEILPRNQEEHVAFLVVGDPFGATTHSDLILRAREKNIEVKVVHNASILSAIGCCGLQLYSFGETTSIPYWSKDWQPSSFYDKIASNRERGLHTLCLLDIKVKEPTMESLTKKKKEYMPPRFMSCSEAAVQLLEVLATKAATTDEKLAFEGSSIAVGLARIGWNDQRIVACSLEEMTKVNLGPPLHCLIIPATKLHPLEEEFLARYTLSKNAFENTMQRRSKMETNKNVLS